MQQQQWVKQWMKQTALAFSSVKKGSES